VDDGAAPDQLNIKHRPERVLNVLRGGLLALIVITLMASVAMRVCDMGIAVVFTLLWAFSPPFTWAFYGMLRTAIVPGGREAEFAGLNLALFSAFIWLPLLVFSVAKETWTIIGAMYLLNVFFGVGIVILCFVDVDRALVAQHSTLGAQRYATFGKVVGQHTTAGSSKVFVGEKGRGSV
jgi:hypothetical protein